MSIANSIIIIDDEAAIRESLSFLLETHGYSPQTFESGDAFLKTDVKALKCPVLMDVRMPGRTGIQVLQIALEINPSLPIIIMSGHGDIPLAVRAVKLGATNFIEKPFQSTEILAMLESVELTKLPLRQPQKKAIPPAKSLSKLSPRELQIAHLLAEGFANKAIAYELGISARTVETHRANLLSKLEIKSLSDLVKLVILEYRS